MISQDDQGQWYFFTSFQLSSLDELKLTRQTLRPPYLESENLPLVELLHSLDIVPIDEGFDKAYGHAFYFTKAVSKEEYPFYLKIANYDGHDDPTLFKKFHYIENEFKGEQTFFLSGFETRSFATITENEYYTKNLHLPINALNYLKLFIYFSRYGVLPSNQMMPRLLGNLWASTQMLKSNANRALFNVVEWE